VLHLRVLAGAAPRAAFARNVFRHKNLKHGFDRVLTLGIVLLWAVALG